MPRHFVVPHTQIRRAGDMKPGDVFHTMLTLTPGEIVTEESRWWLSLPNVPAVREGVPVILTTDVGEWVARVFHAHALLRQDVID